ncbi:sodium-independent sulfate anion transporter-like isoform X2 [Tubulanus polymorphus]|uniref:sodium-independent sulfate anion transporter-like isoform X2 n=1 Tax=Tubulanus polymorphus TaxID=672921 RepID=UPI003DA33948
MTGGEITLHEINVSYKPSSTKPNGSQSNNDEPAAAVIDGHANEEKVEAGRCEELRSQCTSCCLELKNMVCNCEQCREYIRSAFTVQHAQKRFPISTWLPKYRPYDFQCDLIAGLTVGLMVIPQGLAYAVVAELPPQYGLYSAFMGCFIYCLMGTAKDITLGPTAIMSLMTAAFASSPIKQDPTYAIVLCLMTGCIQLAMGLFHLGFLVRYISHPVISSFTSAAAITIAVGQLKNLLGLKNIPREFIEMVEKLIEHITETNLYDMAMGMVCVVLLLIMKKSRDIKFDEENMNLCRKVLKHSIWFLSIARNAIIVIVATLLAYGLWLRNFRQFSLTGPLKPGLPPFKPPSFTVYNGTGPNATVVATTSKLFSDIGAGFAVVALLSLVETIAIGKAFARKNNYKIRPSQELVAIGISNILGSFVSSYPVTGSFSRTAVNSQSGVRTPFGGVFTGVIVILALAFLTPAFRFIPKSALAAVIITAVIQMIDFGICLKMWRVKKVDLVPWFITFVLSFVLGIEYGILVGIGVSILILLYPYGKFSVKKTVHDGVTVLQMEAGYYYPGVDHFSHKFADAVLTGRSTQAVEFGTAQPPVAIVIDCTHVSGFDFTTVEAIVEMYDDCKAKNIIAVFAVLEDNLLDILQAQKIPNFHSAPTVQAAYQLIYDMNDPEQRNELQGSVKPIHESDALLASSDGAPQIHDAGQSTSQLPTGSGDPTLLDYTAVGDNHEFSVNL